MKNALIWIILLAAIAVIIFLVMKKEGTSTEMQNLSSGEEMPANSSAAKPQQTDVRGYANTFHDI